MGNQVCCAGPVAEYEHFHQVHSNNRRKGNHSNIDSDRGPLGVQMPEKRNGRSKSPMSYMERIEQKKQCLLTDKISLDFTKSFNPPMKSQMAIAALTNKNGCKITS